MKHRLSLSIVVAVAFGAPAAGQSPDLQAAVAMSQQVRTAANIVYERANGWEGKLDVYARRGQAPMPTVIYIHGGGWVLGTKEGSALAALPFIAMGYSVVNVEYRLANVTLAPAAIEDCRCALRWVVAHAKEYNFDPDKIVVAGSSAGGHLALTTGIVPTSAGFDRTCQGANEPRVAAIVDFFGITDVADLLDGPSKKPFPENWPYTVQWLGNQPNRDAIAKAASPLTYVRAGLPPTISIHGDSDPTVPYAHSVRLQEALQKTGVPHELITIRGGGHGNFRQEEWQRAYTAIQAFLTKHVTGEKAPPSRARE